MIITRPWPRFESVKDVHRGHQREYEQLQERLESSADTSVRLKDTQGSVNGQYRFYQEMKCYVRDLVECFQEKVRQDPGDPSPNLASGLPLARYSFAVTNGNISVWLRSMPIYVLDMPACVEVVINCWRFFFTLPCRW